MKTRRLLAAVPLCAAVAAGGCGGSSAPGSTAVSTPAPVRPTAATAAESAPTPVRAGGSRAQFAAFARAVNLRLQDVPGYSVDREKHRHHELRMKAFEDGSVFRGCWSFADIKPVFKANSEKFRRGGGLHVRMLQSTVEIAKSAGAARRDLATVRRGLASERVRRCLSRRFDAAGRQAGVMHVGGATVRVTFSRLLIAPLQVGSLTSAGGDGAGFSMSMLVTYDATGHGRHLTVPVPFQVDALAVREGRAEVALAAMAFGEECPSELEAKLFTMLATRGTAAGDAFPATRKT